MFLQHKGILFEIVGKTPFCFAQGDCQTEPDLSGKDRQGSQDLKSNQH
jgi:hypothetical protein